MPHVEFPPFLHRIFGRSDPAPMISFQIVMHLVAAEPQAPEEIEAQIERTIPVVADEARGVALGPVFSADFGENTIELEFTVEAAAASDLHEKVGHVLEVLEHSAGFSFEYRDSTTSRVADLEEAVLA